MAKVQRVYHETSCTCWSKYREKTQASGIEPEGACHQAGYLTQAALNRMKKGHIAPKMSRLEEIAIQLDCPVSFLFHLNHTSLEEKVAVITDILASVPESVQDVLVNLVAETARSMNYLRK